MKNNLMVEVRSPLWVPGVRLHPDSGLFVKLFYATLPHLLFEINLEII